MSKKDRKFRQQQGSYSPVVVNHDQEYAIVRRDLYRVLALNAVYLVVILGLFFANRSSHFVDNFFSKLFHF